MFIIHARFRSWLVLSWTWFNFTFFFHNLGGLFFHFMEFFIVLICNNLSLQVLFSNLCLDVIGNRQRGCV